MAKGKTICNMCGKEFDMWDTQEARGIHDRFGYGSKYDEDKIDLDLCCDCFDNLVDDLRSKCVIDPIIVSN